MYVANLLHLIIYFTDFIFDYNDNILQSAFRFQTSEIIAIFN